MSSIPKTSELGFWEVLNPPIYLVSLLPGLVVIQWNHYRFGWGLLLGVIGVILLQHGINVFNDLVDGQRGADSEKRESWLLYQQKPERVRLHGGVTLVMGFVAGVVGLWITETLWIFPLVGLMTLLGVSYNLGPKPISYGKLGEWVTGICYGPGVFIGYWVLSGRDILDWRVLAGSIGCGAIAVSCLLSHQPKQILTDAAVGKNSFAVRHGAQSTLRWARGTLILFFLCISLGAPNETNWIPLLTGLLLLSVAALWTPVKPKNQLIFGLAGATWGFLC